MGYAISTESLKEEIRELKKGVTTIEIVKEVPVEIIREVIREVEVIKEVKVEIEKPPKKWGTDETNRRLRRHPKFKLPTREVNLENAVDLTDFIIESICNFISPPKVLGEDESFACEDVAAAIKEHLRPEIIERLKQEYSKGLFKPTKRKIEL